MICHQKDTTGVLRKYCQNFAVQIMIGDLLRHGGLETVDTTVLVLGRRKISVFPDIRKNIIYKKRKVGYLDTKTHFENTVYY
jgi:hypothetical protein